MLKILRTVTMSPEQYDIVFCDGMRNPKNSWDRSDSYITHIVDKETEEIADFEFFLGENDEKLANTLAIGGPVHAKYRRMMPIWVDILAPLYWWKEFDTYKVGTVCNSCSTMHKLTAKEFVLDDFSIESLSPSSFRALQETIIQLNLLRKIFLEGGELVNNELKMVSHKPKDPTVWKQMIQLLPTSYNQKRTVMLNYEVISQMDYWRESHKLTEWHTFCDWIKKQKYYIPLIRPDKMPKNEECCGCPAYPVKHPIRTKIVIRTDLIVGKYYGCASFTEGMNRLLGKGLTVEGYIYDVRDFDDIPLRFLHTTKILHDFKLVGYDVEEAPYFISEEMIMEI